MELLASGSVGYGRVKSEVASVVILAFEAVGKSAETEEVGPPSIVCAKVEGAAVSSSAVGPGGFAGSVGFSGGGEVDEGGSGSGEITFGARPGYERIGSARGASLPFDASSIGDAAEC